MIPDRFVWLVWSSTFLLVWLVLYGVYPPGRLVMWRASLLALPFALAEPLFVGSYWNPPSLFDLARTQHFDLESFLFCFGIGGSAAILFNVVTRRPPALRRLRADEARLLIPYQIVLGAPLLPFCFLLSWTLRPIWAGAIGMIVGAAARAWYFPDLRAKTWIGGLLFLGYYLIFLLGLIGLAPGYLERAWLAGGPARVHVLGVPVTELIFALCFGAYWSGLYEQLDRTLSLPARPAAAAAGRRSRGAA